MRPAIAAAGSALAVIAICASAACLLLLLAGCGGSGPRPDPAACKTAMTRAYRYALTHPGAPAATEPAACKGIPAATLNEYAAEIIAQG